MPNKGAAPADELTPETLGWQLRAALPPMRLHSVSLCDADGDVLWLSEGVLGPDEHGYVTEAIGQLSTDASLNGIDRDLEDGRAAVFLPVRAPQGAVVGVAMILIDGKSVTRGLAARLVTPPVRTLLQRLAVLLKPIPSQPPPVDMAHTTLPPQETRPIITALQEPEPPRPPTGTKREARGNGAAPRGLAPLTSEQIDTILTVELTEDEPPPAVSGPRAATPDAATDPALDLARPSPKPRRSASKARAVPDPEPAKNFGPAKDLALSVQQLLKLRSGGRTRRYEVLLRARDDADRNELPHTLVQRAAREIGESALDEYVLSELLGFLSAHPEVWEAEPSSFSVNLSAASVSDEGFAQVIESLLERTGVAPECLGFEIPQSCCVHEPTHVDRFANACAKLGCFIVLDDFTLDPRAVPLLRSKTLKLVKIDPKLTTAAMKDRVSQALVVAIAQASKVLGLHCVAKRVESQATRQWLSATGIDFAQGFALEGPLPLESLAAPVEKSK